MFPKGITIAIEVSKPFRMKPNIDKTCLSISFIWLWFAIHFVGYGYNHLLNDLAKRLSATNEGKG